MAKVTMPLGSFSASGSIGKALTYAQRKGQSVVRQWLKPRNPETNDQGDFRLKFGGMGRGIKCVGALSLYVADAKLNATGIQTWGSKLIKTIMDSYMVDKTAFEAEVTAYEAHAAKATFDSAAVTLGLTEFDMSYKSTTEVFAAGLMVYELAKYGIMVHAANAELFNREPYLTALGSWDAGKVGALLADIQNV